VEGLVYRYRSRAALDGVSLSVPPGMILGLLGANGAGKSTLLRNLCGLLTPLQGSVRVAGAGGYGAQQFGLYEDLTVEENLRFYARAYGLDQATALVRLERSLERFHLEARRRERAGALSHGWRQRLALACALTHQPAVLLLDEATAGLDPA